MCVLGQQMFTLPEHRDNRWTELVEFLPSDSELLRGIWAHTLGVHWNMLVYQFTWKLCQHDPQENSARIRESTPGRSLMSHWEVLALRWPTIALTATNSMNQLHRTLDTDGFDDVLLLFSVIWWQGLMHVNLDWSLSEDLFSGTRSTSARLRCTGDVLLRSVLST